MSPVFGPSVTPRGTPMLGPMAPPASPAMSGLSAMGSPIMSGLSGSIPIVPLEADLQPHAMLRSHEFREGRRVFHVHFGHGFVKSLEAEPVPVGPLGEAAPPPESHRVLTQKTHNIHIHFDNPKYKAGLRLRAYYAVPKMVVIPSSAALRKQKLLAAVDATPPSEPQRVMLVRSLLTTGSVRAACMLVAKWRLHSHFEPALLVERLVQSKCLSTAIRYAREFKLAPSESFSEASLFRSMVGEKQYEGALKHVGAKQATVDGEHTPLDVLRFLVEAGDYAVALKYVHKFGASDSFPPAQLVESALRHEGELTVRTCGMLLKYVRLFGLEHAFPLEGLLERVTASGVTVHEMGGKFVLKGRRRQAVSNPAGMSGSHPGSQTATPGTSPPAAPSIVLSGSAPA